MNVHKTEKVRENTEISHSVRYLSDLDFIRTHGIPNVCECTNSHEKEVYSGKYHILISFPCYGFFRQLEVIEKPK